MIATDQPQCFPKNVIVKVSSKNDGSLLNRAIGRHHPDYVARRIAFCRQAGIDYGNAVYQKIIYGDDQKYAHIEIAGQGDATRNTPDVAADALITTQKNVALFLPVADCAATVFYNPTHQVLALAHLGRHSTYAKLATLVVERLRALGSNSSDLIVWMSPHAQKDHYKLEWFDQANDPDWQGFYEQKPTGGVCLDLAGLNRCLLERCGVLPQNIHVSAIDTVANSDYFSHLAGDSGGRIAVVAMMQ